MKFIFLSFLEFLEYFISSDENGSDILVVPIVWLYQSNPTFIYGGLIFLLCFYAES